MDLKNEREVEATREKLRLLEECYEQERQDFSGDSHVRELSLSSLKRTMNQFKEEIIRYESRNAMMVRQRASS